MTYLIVETFILLLLAVLIGWTIGWLMRGRALDRVRTAAMEAEIARNEAQARCRDCERIKDELETRLAALGGRLGMSGRRSETPAQDPSEDPSQEPAQADPTPAESGTGPEEPQPMAAETMSGRERTDLPGTPPDAAAEPTEAPDDLKLISGVGPKIEGLLNGLGIYHFSQIAAFTPDNVAWVDGYLRFKGRIAREDWVNQAAVLAAGGDTEFSARRRR